VPPRARGRAAEQPEARDPARSLPRYFAASGIAFSMLLGLFEVPDALRDRLFERLLDESKWRAWRLVAYHF